MRKFIIILLSLVFVSKAYCGTVTQASTYATGGQVTAANLNANFAVAINELNGKLDNDNADTTDGFRFVEVVGSLPTAGTEGRVVFLTTDDTLYFDDGSSFNPVVVTPDTAVQGDILFHNGTNWKVLVAGTSGQFLKTQGTSANPTWDTVTLIQDDDGNTKIQVEESADENIIRMDTETSGEVWNMSDAGERIMTKQPSFAAQADGSQTNIAINTEVTMQFATELFDQGNDFASNTFTAPVAGIYQFCTTSNFDQFDRDATSYTFQIKTTDDSFNIRIDSNLDFSADPAIPVGWAVSAYIDMAANDTAKCIIKQFAGTQQTDIDPSCLFMGGLVH